MSDATPPAGFGRPDLTAFARLDGLGLSVTGQRLEPDRAVLACRVVEPDQWCRRCGSEGAARDTVIRRLAHEPLGWRPTVLEVVVRRYRCADCGHVWRQDTSAAAEPRAKLSRTGLRWALEGIVVAHLTVARVAQGLGVAWDTANNAVLAEGKRLLINDPTRFEGVKVIGVDEHVWRHTRRGDKYVTVIIDLTPVRDGAGPARLLDMVEGRSKAAFKTWLADRDDAFRDAVVRLPRTSNGTDVDALAAEPGVDVRVTVDADHAREADLLVLPGSRATTSDLQWLRRTGLADVVLDRARRGAPVLGICGGYQMLLDEIVDDGVEGSETSAGTTVPGLGLLPGRVVFHEDKALARPSGTWRGHDVEGYEIHHGVVEPSGGEDFPGGHAVGAVRGSI